MPRAILIPADNSFPIREVEIPKWNKLADQFFGPGSLFERVVSIPLRQDLSIDNNQPVMVVDEEGRIKRLAVNERATILYVPANTRERAWIAGDALIVGEGFTDEGPDFIALAQHIAVTDIQDEIDRYKNV